MQSVLNNGAFRFTINRAFTAVLQNCKTITRKEQEGTWITPAVQHAYTQLHELGYAHSAEAWMNGELVGGLYGIRLGNVFFGESIGYCQEALRIDKNNIKAIYRIAFSAFVSKTFKPHFRQVLVSITFLPVLSHLQ